MCIFSIFVYGVLGIVVSILSVNINICKVVGSYCLGNNVIKFLSNISC